MTTADYTLLAFCSALTYWTDGEPLTLEDAQALIDNWTAEGNSDQLPAGSTAQDIADMYNKLIA